MVWNMNGPNEFERSIKEALEPYEVPYNSADWAQLERNLVQSSANGRVNRSGFYALLLGGSIAAASSIFAILSPTSSYTDGGAMNGATSMDAMPVRAEVSTRTIVAQQEPIQEPVSAPAILVMTKNDQTQLVRSEPMAIAAPVKPKMEVGAGKGSPMVRPSMTEGCPGTLIEFAAENLPEEGIYLWNFGDGSFSNKPTPNHAFAKSGSFEVMLSHSSSGGGNIHNKPAADRILIYEAPEASFSTLKQEYDNTVPSVHFENRSMGGRSYEWDFGDGATSAIAHPDHVYKKGGLYTVKLTVTNNNGCVDRTERTVRIDRDYDLLATKTFSPNGDGVDDLFIPEALKTLGVKFNLSIFQAQTGTLVYETTDPQRPWNGRISNKGEPCASGDYVWMVEMKDGEKLGGTYNGSLNLVR
jgi:gliding motility-associated-like protein